MKRLGWIALAFLPAVALLALALRPYPHRDLGFLALAFGLPVIGLTWLIFIFAAETNRPILKTTWPLLLSSALIISIWITDWPLHLAFRMAKPELNRLADQLASSDPPSFPQRAGPFLIRDGGMDRTNPFGSVIHKVPYLTVIPNPAGPTHFVRAETAYGFNVWSTTKLSPQWILIRED